MGEQLTDIIESLNQAKERVSIANIDPYHIIFSFWLALMYYRAKVFSIIQIKGISL